MKNEFSSGWVASNSNIPPIEPISGGFTSGRRKEQAGERSHDDHPKLALAESSEIEMPSPRME